MQSAPPLTFHSQSREEMTANEIGDLIEGHFGSASRVKQSAYRDTLPCQFVVELSRLARF